MVAMATVYILQGLVAAGKSTLARQLAQSTGAAILNPDTMVVAGTSENWDARFQQAVQQMWTQATDYLAAGRDVILDMGFWYKADRDQARALAKRYGAAVKHYYLRVPENILRERIVATRPAVWAEKHLADFARNQAAFEPPTPEEAAEVIENY